MAQKIKQGNIFGRIGTNIGKGLAESVPKEIDRYRLAEGLKNFEENASNLTPIQQFARLASIPGITPQMIQTGGELGKQQARAQALIQSQNQDKKNTPNPFENRMANTASEPTSVPSLPKRKPLSEIIKGNIPPTEEEKYQFAGNAYTKDPDRFGHDPNKALDYSEKHFEQQAKIDAAYEKQHERLTKIQDDVKSRLGQFSKDLLGAKVPGDVYSDIESEAVQSVKDPDQGGKGWTEEQAIKEYGKKLSSVSKEYQNLKDLGGIGTISFKPAKETLSDIKKIQKSFKARNDTENMAAMLVADSGISYPFSYSLSQPVYDEPKLNSELRKIPELERSEQLFETVIPNQREKTLEVSRRLAPLLGENGSPMGMAYELEKRGYDPATWLEYVKENEKKLKLSVNQSEQLDKSRSYRPSWNDWWLSSWTGLD